jgi:hypothetical protein
MDFSIGSGGVSTQNILRVDGVGGCEIYRPSSWPKKIRKLKKKIDFF